MFDRLLFWLREKARLLFGENTTVSASVSYSMENAIILWAQMYDTGGPWCHGGKNALHSLKLAQSVASELARLTTLEMECLVSGSARADSINTMLQPFIADLRTPVEYGCALGGILFRPFLDAQGCIQIDAVQGDCFCPTRFDSSGRMTGAIFYDHLVRGNRIYTRLEDHEFSGSTHSITVKAFRSMTSTDLGIEVPLTDVPEWAAISPHTEFSDVDRPLWGYFRVSSGNSTDRHSPLGVSVYAAAVDTIHDADEQYGRLLWEYDGGQLALDVDQTALRPGINGESVMPQREQRLYRNWLNGSSGANGRNLYEVFAPALRDESYRRGMDTMLKRVEFQCGLAYGTLSDPQNVDKTAEEIRSSKQRSYTTVKDLQRALGNALTDLVYSISKLLDAQWNSGAAVSPPGDCNVTFDFDDSIISDPKERKQMYWGYVTAGKFPFWRYLVEFEGYSEDDAKAIAAEAGLLIVESDVIVKKHTLQSLFDGAQARKDCGIAAAVTVDEHEAINYPYLYAKGKENQVFPEKKHLSFCCSLLTTDFLRAFDFHSLNPEKNWFYVTISHQALEKGFVNYLFTTLTVWHRPHSSRPWKQLKYTNPLKYYWLKFTKGLDKI